ncbi:DUF4331 family protein [Pseudenhygromyxa sp. WMMC2535]|uniref:DUF4331 family protein n=1 Tax=Pseudenhygromyxa sp. WMMC2535 TaxID=2712867 RepID=UPI001553CB76|nr:DUF4331 family protein [Pseudenhygromyxa sp. WMMC2535]NVB39350.1 DUF4331 family protein [Pseudenhygromyxa sp. WMMC2535]
MKTTMKINTTLFNASLLTFAAMFASACSDDGEGNDDEVGDTTTDTTTDAGTDTDSDTETTDSGTDTDTDSDTDTGEDPFVFDESAPEAYSQVDRMGMPAINTAVITSKDAYNADSPESDIQGDYAGEISDNLTAIHSILDDDLISLALVPCAVDDCLGQAGPLVIPDTLKLDLETTAGFPNGRRLSDPVMDVTLAVVLLDFTIPGQDAAALVGALNPTENDVPFLDEFPYLAAPN